MVLVGCVGVREKEKESRSRCATVCLSSACNAFATTRVKGKRRQMFKNRENSVSLLAKEGGRLVLHRRCRKSINSHAIFVHTGRVQSKISV